MLNSTSLLADALGRNLAETYRRIYSDQEPQIAAGLDEAARLVIDAAGNTVAPPRGASNAFLMRYHVERGRIFVRERFAQVPYVDEERIAAAHSPGRHSYKG